ncbi:hypothetical protein PS689_01621 [Pseudomonas fluorescens]|nr:hypothetical protein PS689_01621 [Pseudomonas fluorescens]
MPTRSMGRIGVLETTLIVPTLQRGNAAQDAPRPLWNATHISVTTRPLGAWTSSTINPGCAFIQLYTRITEHADDQPHKP